VTGNDAGRGTLIAALAEAAFLIGLERNRFFYMLFLVWLLGDLEYVMDSSALQRFLCSDVVEMASCAPLFVNDNDRR
jgi:alpha-L-arabinofuranosidase